MSTPLRKTLRISGYIILTLVVGAVVGCVALDRPIPEGSEGPKAEELTQKVLEYIDAEAWYKTAVVQFSFMGQHNYLWDKERDVAQVSWASYRVLIDLGSKEGVVWEDGKRLFGDEGERMVQKAWEYWCNDAFWFNPLVKMYDKGVTRQYVALDGPQEGLLVTYHEGGITPGDSYLWYINPDGEPTHWRMWVQALPIGGIQVPWEAWKMLHTGAKVATIHKSGLLKLTFDNVKSADSVEELVGEDIFEPLFNPI